MSHLEQILSCLIVAISVGGIAKAKEPLRMVPLQVSQANPQSQ